ncbi:Glucosamine 6-phosphate N-acetyltransferase like protein [Aduncisulcus paluster]|uniref:Glucosamine 6-phosphate N-acetyltransferase n=1 Tax=Aduncisulcus paluster TaxID=2918883 RepID=A0ABQ5KUF4_9EUKA|nr:Glucosamine 6-phosphate N-acetyltransferase like protein [Aduncisulcus paluster]
MTLTCDIAEGFEIRQAVPRDYYKKHLEVLAQLTDVGIVSHKQYVNFVTFATLSQNTYVAVIEHLPSKKIIGSATLFVEKKLIHSCSSCGHIEDVVVDSTYRGKGLGKSLVHHLVGKARLLGCYKVILDCAEKNVKFYEKCGMKQKEKKMEVRFE